MKLMSEAMQEAMRQMQRGDLQAATRALQQRFEIKAPSWPKPNGGADSCRAPAATANCIDGEFEVIDEPRPVATPKPHVKWRWQPARGPAEASTGGQFMTRGFSGAHGSISYKLFVPDALGSEPAPLLLMLHGCTQSPEDFARGTQMNARARELGYVVAYPAQTIERNPNRCWNWFRAGDQQRDCGEPALLAELCAHLIRTHGLDPRRVYAAGLSAGGAMAAVLANAYPDLFAAIGVHSGLPAGTAHDLQSAFAAMRQGTVGHGPATARVVCQGAVPVIVFHGDGDTTVHPSNASIVVAQRLAAARGIGAGASDDAPHTIERGAAPGGYQYTRKLYRAADGRLVAEHWVVHGAAHAWSGGNPAGSFTDPAGPDASAQMLRFFAECAAECTVQA